jgi:hypothetical protein
VNEVETSKVDETGWIERRRHREVQDETTRVCRKMWEGDTRIHTRRRGRTNTKNAMAIVMGLQQRATLSGNGSSTVTLLQVITIAYITTR